MVCSQTGTAVLKRSSIQGGGSPYVPGMFFTTSIKDVYRISIILHTLVKLYLVGRMARSPGTIKSIYLPILSSNVNALKSDIISGYTTHTVSIRESGIHTGHTSVIKVGRNDDLYSKAIYHAWRMYPQYIRYSYYFGDHS